MRFLEVLIMTSLSCYGEKEFLQFPRSQNFET